MDKISVRCCVDLGFNVPHRLAWATPIRPCSLSTCQSEKEMLSKKPKKTPLCITSEINKQAAHPDEGALFRFICK